MSRRKYKAELLEKVREGEIECPEGTVLSVEGSEDEDEYLTELETTRQNSRVDSNLVITKESSQQEERPELGRTKSSVIEEDEAGENADSSQPENGWLSDSGLSSEQQAKLFRLMGGKSGEDLGLVNKRHNLDYKQINSEMEEIYNKSVKKKFSCKMGGLGNA